MNEKKKLGFMLGIIAILTLIIIVICIMNEIEMRKLLKNIDETMKTEEVQVFYLARPTCYYCNLLKPITDTLKEEYNLTYYEINTDNYSKNQLNRILKHFGININTFGTPDLVFTKNGEVIGEHGGYADENVIFDLFQTYGLIPEDATLEFQYISYDSFKTMWNDGEKHLMMIGETGEASLTARNTLKSFIRVYGLTISYMDIAETEDNTGYTELLKMIGHSSQVIYPILMIVENGTILAETNGTTIEAYGEFLRTNGYIVS